MQVVIEISEYFFRQVVNTGKTYDNAVYVAFKNGIVLPSEHGDLIDRDCLENEFGTEDADIYAKDIIREMPVIVPREGASE